MPFFVAFFQFGFVVTHRIKSVVRQGRLVFCHLLREFTESSGVIALHRAALIGDLTPFIDTGKLLQQNVACTGLRAVIERLAFEVDLTVNRCLEQENFCL
ncbi:hypothetical protein D3C76_1129100 [compost metagenome]